MPAEPISFVGFSVFPFLLSTMRPHLLSHSGFLSSILFWLSMTTLVSCTTVENAEMDPGVEVVRVVQDERGFHLTVDGRPFFVKGINWDYFPIGTNYAYSLWSQPDDIIEDALEREMSALRSMGVNTIRHYVGIPPRWVAYIHEHFGIYTILNHPLGRYGVSLGGEWIPQTDYADPAAREVITEEVLAQVEAFRDTPGILMWLLGNENNYGLVWSSAETEDLPEEEQDIARATPLYTLFGEVAQRIKETDTLRPVAMANGDLGYAELIAAHAQAVDIFGTNVYRGISFTDAFEQADRLLGKPLLFTEFGSDAYNAREQREDQLEQAVFLKAQWQEIIQNAAGMDGFGNSLGGLTFQWSDGWWKYQQDTNLDVHDTHASWSNAGYPSDFQDGANNMNEEWFGVMAKGPSDARQQFDLIPRAAFYTLQQVHQIDPYQVGISVEAVQEQFSRIDPEADVHRARSSHVSYD